MTLELPTELPMLSLAVAFYLLANLFPKIGEGRLVGPASKLLEYAIFLKIASMLLGL